MAIPNEGSGIESDEALFERFRGGGDRAALTALVERHVDTVAGVCARILQSHLAEEAAQETFVQAIRHAPGFRRGGTFKKWLIGIAVNSCRRAARQERNTVARENNLRNDPMTSGSATATDSAAVKGELLGALDASLLEFSPDERAAMVLHFGHGFSQADVAEMLSRPKGTVGSWLSSGIGRLRELMRRRGHTVGEESLALLLITVPASFRSTAVHAAVLKAAASVKPLPAILLKGATVMKIGIAAAVIASAAVFYFAAPNGDGADTKGPVTGPADKPANAPASIGTPDKDLAAILNKRITVSYRDEYIAAILADLWGRTGLRSAVPFPIQTSAVFTLNAKDQTVREVLEKIASQGGLLLEYHRDTAVFWGKAPDNVIAELEKHLRTGDQMQRAKAIYNLSMLGDKRIYPLLLNATRDPDEVIAIKAIQMLAKQQSNHWTHGEFASVLRQLDGTDAYVDPLMKGITLERVEKRGVSGYRDEAWRIVFSFDGPRARQVMREFMKRPNYLSNAAEQELAAMADDSIEQIIQSGLKSQAISEKKHAIRLLGLEHNTHAVDRLLPLLNEMDLRIDAAYQLQYCWDPRIAPALIRLGKDSDPLIRKAAVESLCKIRDPRGLETVYEALKDSDYNVRYHAAVLISFLPNVDSKVIDRIFEMIENRSIYKDVSNPNCTGPDVFGLQNMRDDYARDRWADLLESEKPELRAGAAFATQYADRPLKDPRLIDGLLKLLNDHTRLPERGNQEVRQVAISALGECRESRVREALSKLPELQPGAAVSWMDNHTGSVKAAAFHAWLHTLPDPVTTILDLPGENIGLLEGTWRDDPRIAERMIQLVKSPNAETRIYAIAALNGELLAIPALIEALKDSDQKVRQSAANLLAPSADPRAVKSVLDYVQTVSESDRQSILRLFAINHPDIHVDLSAAKSGTDIASPSDLPPPDMKKLEAMLTAAKDEARGKIKAGVEKAMGKRPNISPEMAALMRSSSVQDVWLKLVVDGAFKANAMLPLEQKYRSSCEAIRRMREPSTGLEGDAFIEDYITKSIEESVQAAGGASKIGDSTKKKKKAGAVNANGIDQLP